MREAFALQKFLTLFSQKVLADTQLKELGTNYLVLCEKVLTKSMTMHADFWLVGIVYTRSYVLALSHITLPSVLIWLCNFYVTLGINWLRFSRNLYAP